MRYTGLEFQGAFQDSGFRTYVLKVPGSPIFHCADFLIRSRLRGENPFREKTPRQKREASRIPGLRPSYSRPRTSIDMSPSSNPEASDSSPNGKLAKPNLSHLGSIRWLDHAATRVRAQERDAAILEFMSLPNYNFDFAMVFTSGIAPYVSDEASGPTERFIQNYGTRMHHIAFQTEQIDETYQALKRDGMQFLIELVGSPEEGLKQTFSEGSKNTQLVTEYIHRYGGFDGFFTKSNVTLLTAATGKQ